ncbi:MAG: tRNA (adenosine(37)-N6)-threonylcarbamoyltransferase complex dimerization subunit type 1 TsaB [Gammaproteobacteria bacterium]|jgi:tRNA threonylcarbamoyladenosine biosynthesis protein TsaB|nr:tRNA (adenosine(37)-N6)-threonylcarbamoyltransferase complex dimerization subunit type 1 TsaB [Gammaproteobacteria bacterium]
MSDWRCLAIETATEQGSVAVAAGGRIYTRDLTAARNSSREVYRVAQELLREAAISVADLNCVACGSGPGSFTGVRVAVAATQGLGYSLQIPVIGISTLAALAQAAVEQGLSGYLAPCLDARMGELYVGLYASKAGELAAAAADDRLLAPDDLGAMAGAESVLGVGAGWEAYPLPVQANISLMKARSVIWPTATAVLSLAEARYRAGEYVDPAQLVPNYLRNNVAKRQRFRS